MAMLVAGNAVIDVGRPACHFNEHVFDLVLGSNQSNNEYLMKDRAVSVFHQPPDRFNCAQAVLDAYQSVTGQIVAPVASFKPFGGGRAPGGECGALYAACQAMPDASPKIRSSFAERAGTTLCREMNSLTCVQCVALATELLQQNMGGTNVPASESREADSASRPQQSLTS